MADELRVEVEGETVGEAKWLALRELERRLPGLDRTTVEFQVISEGERGLLGLGREPAKIVAVAPGAARPLEGAPRVAAERGPAPDESEAAGLVRRLLELTEDAIGARFSIAIEEDDATITATCSGTDLGLLIGKHGQTIDALQYLTNAVLHRHGVGKEAVIDAAGYRDRRHDALAAIAQRAAAEALATGRPVELEPMTSVERKVVHLHLKDDERVETGSDGSEPNRFVVVRPAGG
jgi:spoIIIJ-associated protein